jgi:hypothetical protein
MSSVAMFKITQNTFRYFTFAEILLMAAINQAEAKPKFDSVVRNRYGRMN